MRDSTASCALLAGCLLGSHLGRLRTIRYSNVHRTFELRSCPHGFESLLFSYENKKTSMWMSFCFVDDDLFEPLYGKCSFSLREVNLHCLVHEKTSYIESYNSLGNMLPCNSKEISSVKFPAFRIISAACKSILTEVE